jgi:hypothetical protein
MALVLVALWLLLVSAALAKGTPGCERPHGASPSPGRNPLTDCFLGPPQILTRAQWGARPPVAPMKRQRVVHITIHHIGHEMAVDTDPAGYMRRLQKWCQEPARLDDGRERAAWPDIPYHYVIFANGVVAEGRPAEYVGDTNTTYDPTGHLLIVLAGDFEKQTPTEAQLDALVSLCVQACRACHLPPAAIRGHRDYADTDCPGAHVYARMEEVRSRVRQRLSAQP